MYIGCDVEYSNEFGKGKYTSGGVFKDGDGRWKLRMTDCGAVRLDNCKLVLRLLSSITKKECLDYVKLIAPNADDIEESSAILYDGLQKKSRITDETHHRFVDYARSIGICLPFMGIDPVIEAWAVLSE